MDWEERYARFGRVFGDHPTPFLSSLLESGFLSEGFSAALVPGDGYGRNGLALARAGVAVTACDLSPTAVRRAAEQARRESLPYVSRAADLADASQAEAFARSVAPADLLASLWFRIPDEAAGCRWNALACRALRPAGVILVVTAQGLASPREEQSRWPSGIVWEDRSTTEETRLIGRLPLG